VGKPIRRWLIRRNLSAQDPLGEVADERCLRNVPERYRSDAKVQGIARLLLVVRNESAQIADEMHFGRIRRDHSHNDFGLLAEPNTILGGILLKEPAENALYRRVWWLAAIDPIARFG